MATDLNKGFRLGPWQVQPQLGSVSGPGGDRHLEPKVMDVLVCLAATAGELVSRDQLLQSVWGERAFSEEPLNRAIGELRRALGDSPKKPTYIETVPKRGYRLLVDVVAEAQARVAAGGATSADAAVIHSTPNLSRRTHSRTVIYGAVTLVVVAGGYMLVDQALNEFDAAPTISVAERPTVAVLPFCNLGAGEVDEHFAAGISEDLTTVLAKSPDLIVISRNATSQYACKPESIAQVGRDLGAHYLVTGSARIAAGRRLRLSVQFTNADLDQVVWGDTYEKDLLPASVFEVQAEIADNIARSLEVEVIHWEGQAVTDNPNAWDLYARGRFLVRRSLPDEVEQGRRLLQQAVAADPNLAEAHTYLGQTYVYDYMLSWDPNPALLDLAEGHIRSALAIDNNNHAGQTHMAFIHVLRGRASAARREAERAIKSVPSYDTAYAALGLSRLLVGDGAQAKKAFLEALKLNPTTPQGRLGAFWAFLGTALHLEGDTEAAAEYWERARRSIPGVGQGPILLANHYQSSGRHDEAKRVVTEILALHPDATAANGYRYLVARMPESSVPTRLQENLRAAGLP